MDPTAALVVVGVLVALALAAAAGLFDRTRRVRRTRVAPPVETVVERPARRVVVEEEPPVRRVVE